MGRRVGQVAGALAFFLMLARLGRLLESGQFQPRWQLILGASAFLGAVAWWLLSQITSHSGIRIAIFGVGGLLLALRIIAPETLTGLFLPTAETVDAVGAEFELAFRTIRSGVPPVLPRPGLLAVLSLVMWTVGALYTWGSTDGPYAALFLPSLVMYLQFAVYDRKEVLLYWLMGTAIVLSLAILSLALERRQESGRARDSEGRPLERRTVSVAVAITALLSVSAIVLADNAHGLVSEYGNLPWRTGGSGFGGGSGGGIRFDGLVGLRQRVINRSDEAVFTAVVVGDLPDSGEYWRVQTLDQYDNDEWQPATSNSRHYQPGQPLASEDDVYQGTRYDLLAIVEINALRTDLAPTLGVPIEIQDDPSLGELRHPTEFNMFPSAEIAILSGMAEGDQYQVRTLLPDRQADLGVLASTDQGDLSPMFANARDQGEFNFEAGRASSDVVAPPDLERYTQLPDNIPGSITRIARQITEGATTDFERAWMLQAWFRDPGVFTYNTNVSTGHDSLVLEDWLTDSTSQNYREGYCEQFAASMGVLLRTLDVPTRVVWGFTPGSARERVDGATEIVVRDTNAHAWVEVFLEPYGWYPFDPTPRGEFQAPDITAGFDPQEMVPDRQGGSGIDIPDSGGGTLGGEGIFGEPEQPNVVFGSTRWWLAIFALVPIAIGALPGYKWIRRRRRLRRIKDGDISAAWDEVVDRLADLGEDLPPSLTPLELARSKDTALVPLARDYSAALYGGKTGLAQESDLIGVEWWITRNYDTSQRLVAGFSVKSLLR